VEPYLKANGVEYLIACGVKTGYTPRGIPHAWLIGPDGNVVWKGHPSGLAHGTIEEHLKNVRLKPAFDDLPKGLSKAAKSLNAGKYAQGLKELEKSADDPDDGAAAKAAIARVEAYGADRLARADALAEAGAYREAMALCEEVEDGFKGHAVGDQAKDKLDAWKKDKTVKAELEGQEVLDKAEAFERAGRKPEAAKLLKSIVDGKKFEGTKVRAKAEERLKALGA
jgi:tetratricopeptide (TPR) repeat protein